jgi:hypothetical protein
METLDIKYVSGTNFYFNPIDEECQEVIIQLENGNLSRDGYMSYPKDTKSQVRTRITTGGQQRI